MHTRQVSDVGGLHGRIEHDDAGDQPPYRVADRRENQERRRGGTEPNEDGGARVDAIRQTTGNRRRGRPAIPTRLSRPATRLPRWARVNRKDAVYDCVGMAPHTVSNADVSTLAICSAVRFSICDRSSMNTS